MVDPYAHSWISRMNNGSNARLCEAVITRCCQMGTVRLMAKTFVRSINTRQSCGYTEQCVPEYQTARVLVRISQDICSHLCLDLLFPDAMSQALFQRAIVFGHEAKPCSA